MVHKNLIVFHNLLKKFEQSRFREAVLVIQFKLMYLTEEYSSRVFQNLDFCNSIMYTLQAKVQVMDVNEDC
ncbi:hypothetical protein D910_06292 [Dendroctonus ponderosae]|uniref:Uncharacterized protein n=1 Tax=Dendroctonus ponderosae TaxID=77166 RepID=U4U4V4_DENPD|nr:hypothetical protein D910_06292 [Dendroctonus ponderosae]